MLDNEKMSLRKLQTVMHHCGEQTVKQLLPVTANLLSIAQNC